MGDVKLLDCTLRDGGYLNYWKFGYDNIISVFERVVSAGTDIIEVGFLDGRVEYDRDRSIFPDTKAIRQTYGGLDRKNALVFKNTLVS